MVGSAVSQWGRSLAGPTNLGTKRSVHGFVLVFNLRLFLSIYLSQSWKMFKMLKIKLIQSDVQKWDVLFGSATAEKKLEKRCY